MDVQQDLDGRRSTETTENYAETLEIGMSEKDIDVPSDEPEIKTFYQIRILEGTTLSRSNFNWNPNTGRLTITAFQGNECIDLQVSQKRTTVTEKWFAGRNVWGCNLDEWISFMENYEYAPPEFLAWLRFAIGFAQDSELEEAEKMVRDFVQALLANDTEKASEATKSMTEFYMRGL